MGAHESGGAPDRRVVINPIQTRLADWLHAQRCRTTRLFETSRQLSREKRSGWEFRILPGPPRILPNREISRRRPRSPQLAGIRGCVSVSADTVSGLNAILRGLSLCRGIPFPRCRFGRGISFPRCRSILAHRAAEAVGRDQLYRAATAWHNAALNKMRRGERCCHQQCRLRAGHNQR